MRQAVRKRRRQRLILLASSLAAIGAGVLIVLFVQGGDEEPKRSAAPSNTIVAPTPQPVACGAELPAAAASRKASYSAPTDQKLDKDKSYILRLETSCGDIEVELDVIQSPDTANSVAFLARKGFYNGLVFHRLCDGFVAQGGDPRGDGSGGPGYDIIEPPPDDFKYTRGVVAMAKGGNDPPGSSGSQFYIVTADDAGLPPDYAVLGKVVDGEKAVDKIAEYGRPCPPGQDSPEPEAFVYIARANILEA